MHLVLRFEHSAKTDVTSVFRLALCLLFVCQCVCGGSLPVCVAFFVNCLESRADTTQNLQNLLFRH